jgi:hypothetical protein
MLVLGIYQLTKDHGCPVLICSLIISNPAHVTEGISWCRVPVSGTLLEIHHGSWSRTDERHGADDASDRADGGKNAVAAGCGT